MAYWAPASPILTAAHSRVFEKQILGINTFNLYIWPHIAIVYLSPRIETTACLFRQEAGTVRAVQRDRRF